MDIKSEDTSDLPENVDIKFKESIQIDMKPTAAKPTPDYIIKNESCAIDISETEKVAHIKEEMSWNNISIRKNIVKIENTDMLTVSMDKLIDEIQESKDSIIDETLKAPEEIIFDQQEAITGVVENSSISENKINSDSKNLENRQSLSNLNTNLETSPNQQKRKRSRPPFRKRSKKAKLVDKSLAKVEIALENICSPEAIAADDVEYCLNVTNLPKKWSFMDIKNYIDTQCGPVDEIEMLKDDKGNGGIRLTYQTDIECKEAMNKLKNKEVDGTKLIVTMTVESLETEIEEQPEQAQDVSEELEAPAPPSNSKPWRPDLDSWEIDPEGLYGLKKSFLKSLNITPPLDRWVHVSNFRCDKSDLKELLDMAGNVLMCAVVQTPQKYANVMYSHPLEAVQAVSMLNGQSFYGQNIKIIMVQSPADTILLPKGLFTVGAGLGANGKPLRNVVKHYHRFLTNEPCSVSRVAFEDPKNSDTNVNGTADDENATFTVRNVEALHKMASSNAEKSTPEKSTAVTTSNTTKPAGNTIPAKVQAKTNPVTTTNAAQNVKPQGTVKKPDVTPPAKSPARQQYQSQNNYQSRNVGSNFGQFGPPNRPMGPGPRMGRPFGPGPRPGWNSPGPMGPGPMGGPRPMGPGPMGPGPMGGPRPMGPGPMGPGPMGPGPMGPGPMGPRLMGPGPMGQGPMGQGPMGPGPMGQGPMGGPMPMGGAMHGHMPGQMPAQMPGQMPGHMQSHMPGGLQIYPGNEPVQLQLSNLPPSTSFPILCEKMAACGSVVSIQLSTPGCAVVTFANRMQADACYQSYHNVIIDGHMIQVKYTQ